MQIIFKQFFSSSHWKIKIKKIHQMRSTILCVFISKLPDWKKRSNWKRFDGETRCIIVRIVIFEIELRENRTSIRRRWRDSGNKPIHTRDTFPSKIPQRFCEIRAADERTMVAFVVCFSHMRFYNIRTVATTV